jgi:hypothetical protein
MQRQKQRGKRHKEEGGMTGPAFRLATLPFPHAFCLLLVLSGCAQTPVRDDPLIGGNTPLPPASPGLAATGTPGAPVAPVPPLPSSSSAVSTAALAANEKPLEGSRPLQMGDQHDKLVNRSTWQGAGIDAEKAARGPALGKPEEIAAPDRKDVDPATAGFIPSVGFARASTAGDSLDQLLAQLKQIGANYNLEKTVGNGFRLTCEVPKKNDPTKVRTYEVTATTEAAAVRAVLDKIDADQ